MTSGSFTTIIRNYQPARVSVRFNAQDTASVAGVDRTALARYANRGLTPPG